MTLKKKLDSIDWNFDKSLSREDIHSIHPYPAKFISEVPRYLIDFLEIKENTYILDPFCGCGVTLVEAQDKKIPSIGIDLNPIACLISYTKTNHIPESFLEVSEYCVKNAKSLKKVDIPNIPNLDHWYKKDIQIAISSLISNVNKLSNANMEKFLKLALSSILVRISNQESDTRYAAIYKNYHYEDVFKLFMNSCKRIYKYCSARDTSTESIIINKNILDTTNEDINNKVGLVITSPPYPNAYEYWLYHKYRMWWLGYDPINVKEKEIGARAHYFKRNHHTEEDFKDNMIYLFNLLSKIMVKNSYACFLIGRSIIHGKEVDNSLILTKSAKINGFKLTYKKKRNIKKSRKSFNLSYGKICEEYILIFKK